MTNRPTNHDRKAEAKKPATPDFSKYKVCNSYSNPAPNNSSYGGEGKENQRISRKHLIELDMSLGERDKKVLSAIQRHRYLMTGQIQRLFFYGCCLAQCRSESFRPLFEKASEYGACRCAVPPDRGNTGRIGVLSLVYLSCRRTSAVPSRLQSSTRQTIF